MAKRGKSVTIENARILFRNFSGAEGRYNAAGVRSFCVLLDEDLAHDLIDDGWNVKFLQPLTDSNDPPQPYIQVKVNYANTPPKIVLVSHHGKSILDEQKVNMLDFAEIENVDLIFTPYRWEMSGRTGITAYLKTMYVTIAEDELESKYSSTPDSAYEAIGGCGRCEECDGHCGGGY